MTCIVGLQHEGKVYLGGDRAQANYSIYTSMAAPKVFRKGNMVFGYTTSFRFGNLIEYTLVLPQRKVDQPLEEYVYGELIDAIRSCLKQGGYAKVDNNVEKGGEALFGFDGRLFQLQEDFSIITNSFGYDAVGSGMYVALGSLYTTGKLTQDPKKRVKLALEAAVTLVPTVCAPLDVISV